MKITCPNCSQPLGDDVKLCPKCGINLALAVMLAESALLSSSQLSAGHPFFAGSPISPEILVPKLGDYLIEKGILSEEELARALDRQRQSALEGKPKLIGQTLLEMKLVGQQELDQAVTEQILQLQAALQAYNRNLEERVNERTLDLQNALNKLTELSQLKSNFISTISHELRTPLTHLKGYLNLLSEGELGPLNHEQRKIIDVIQRAESRLEQLIDDLISFSLASRGDLTLSLEPVDAVEIVRGAAARVHRAAEDKEIELSVETSGSPIMITIDIEKMIWVLYQLLDNAIKFTSKNGRVSIKVASDDKIVLFSVVDTGIGIPEERMPEIFEPFHQLDSSDRRQYSGIGLGLALVKRIIEAHASSIKVRSQRGEGTCFEFSLPVR
jgi:signal transduction histidine kinase